MATKQEKPKYEQTIKLRTPVGVSKYFQLFESKDSEYGPKYNLTLELTKEDAAAFEKQVNDFLNKAAVEAKKVKPKTIVVPFELPLSKENIPTVYLAKSAAYANGDVSPPPPVYDASLQPIVDKIAVGKGSKVVASVEVSTRLKDGVFKVSAPKLRAAQIIELVEYAGGSKQVDAASDFEAVEGYTFTKQEAQENLDGDESF